MNLDSLSEEELKEIRRAFTVFMTKMVKNLKANYSKMKKRKQEWDFVPLNEYVEKEISLSVYDDDIFCFDSVKNYEEISLMMTKNKNRRAINRLSKREKQIIYYLFIKDYTEEEIAKILNIDVRTVKNLKFSTYKKLRLYMKEEE